MGLSTTLKAKPREVRSSNHAGRLRAAGLLPAVLYGPGLAGAQSLTLDYAEFRTACLTAEGNRSLFTLDVEGGGAYPVMLKERQVDPVSRRMLHVDFLRIEPGKPISVKVPLTLVGKAVGVEKGGQIQQAEREMTVSGLPEAIPAQIEADVTSLALGQTLHLSQVKLPASLTLVKTVDLPVAAVAVPKGIKLEAEAPAAAPEPAKKDGKK
ncbi:MAG: 50S ribosomal protein L25 [Deltaproteobacteria bacterium]|nr:50S ribosomal protein L25 [Deltaproteobacteria bacterium]